MKKVYIETHRMTCQHFEQKGTMEIPKSVNLLSYGICDIWCHKVLGD